MLFHFCRNIVGLMHYLLFYFGSRFTESGFCALYIICTISILNLHLSFFFIFYFFFTLSPFPFLKKHGWCSVFINCAGRLFPIPSFPRVCIVRLSWILSWIFPFIFVHILICIFIFYYLFISVFVSGCSYHVILMEIFHNGDLTKDQKKYKVSLMVTFSFHFFFFYFANCKIFKSWRIFQTINQGV